MAERVEVKGLKQLSMNLRALPDKVQKRVVMGALSKGAAIITDSARARALSQFHEYSEGYMAEFITHKARKSGSQGVKTRGVGVEGGGRKPKKGDKQFPYYWRFLEFGTVKYNARPFLRPAYDANRQKVLNTIINALRVGIDREEKKLKK